MQNLEYKILNKLCLVNFKFVMLVLFFTSLCFLYVLYGTGFADVLELNNGTKLTCVIVLEDTKHLVVETQFGSMTLTRAAIKSATRDSGEKDLLLRGDFYFSRGDYDSAMKQYTDAIVQYPASQAARAKYRKTRELVDEAEKKKMEKLGNTESINTPDLTPETKDAVTAHLKSKERKLVTLVLNGFGAYPTDNTRGKDKAALAAAQFDALKKAFGDAVGIGFILKKEKITILPPGALPNCKTKILDKQKVENLGYAIQLQVQCPPGSVLTKIPESLPEQEVTGTVSLLKYKNKDYKSAAVDEAYRIAVLNVLSSSGQVQPNQVVSGRIFVIEPLVGTFIGETYQVKTKVKVWFD